jgi:hypothetical protein
MKPKQQILTPKFFLLSQRNKILKMVRKLKFWKADLQETTIGIRLKQEIKNW